MDNDDKIVDEHRNEVLLFLKDELQPLSQEKPHAYDLEKEYEKTGKNKSPFIWVLMGCCVVVAGIFTFGISKYVDYNNNKIKVNIDVFNDLNLRNLLDIVSQTKEQQNQSIKEKSQLEAELSYAIKQAEQKRDADLFTLQSMKYGKSETQRRSAVIRQECADSIRKLHADYDVRIAAQDNLINQYQKQLSEYDSNKVEQAQKQEAVIDSERQLHEIEKQQLADKYEKNLEAYRTQMASVQKETLERQKSAVSEVTKKYQQEIDALDPVLPDKDGLLKKATSQEQGAAFEGDTVVKTLAPEASSEFRAAVTTVGKSYADFDTVKKIVASIPQKNSIPSYVQAMGAFAYSAGNYLTAASIQEINRLVSSIDSYKQQLVDAQKQKEAAVAAVTAEKVGVEQQNEMYQSYLESVCLQNKWQGLVIASSTTVKIPVYVVQNSRVYVDGSENADAKVHAIFKRKNSTIATGTLSFEDGSYYCTPNDVSAGSRIRVGDWLDIEPPSAIPEK